ncbi:hypothetical protein MTO96_033635, partial [Rhipicephalus appendiculatus]
EFVFKHYATEPNTHPALRADAVPKSCCSTLTAGDIFWSPSITEPPRLTRGYIPPPNEGLYQQEPGLEKDVLRTLDHILVNVRSIRKKNSGANNVVMQFPKDCPALTLSPLVELVESDKYLSDQAHMESVLCEKHFAPTDFVRTATYTDAQTGKVIEVPLERVRLKETAVPSVFANCPKYMSRPTPSALEAPEEKKARLEAASLRAAIELSVAAQEEESRKNKVGSFAEFCHALSNFSVSDFWTVIIKESKVVFLDLALQRAPAVRSSVAVSVDLCIDVFIGEARIENLPSVNVPSHLQDLRQLNEVLQSVEQLDVSHSSDDNQKAHRLLKIVLTLLEDVCRRNRIDKFE